MSQLSLADETSWACHACTLLNSIGLGDPTTARCEACGTLRSSSPKEKVLLIMRGLPGSGKSTLAKTIEGKVLSADDFFVGRDGKYKYNPNAAWRAHKKCQSRTKEHMEHAVPMIIIDNTNVEKKDMIPYVKLACENGYTVKVCEPNTPWKFDPPMLFAKNTHNVPLDTIESMLRRYQRNITATDLVQSVRAKQPTGSRTVVSSAAGGASTATGLSETAVGNAKERRQRYSHGNYASATCVSEQSGCDSVSSAAAAERDEPCRASQPKRARLETHAPTTAPSRNFPLFSLTALPSERESNGVVAVSDGVEVKFSVSLHSILRIHRFTSTVHFNYKFDLPWLVQQYPRAARAMPMLIVHGYLSHSDHAQTLKAHAVRLRQPDNGNEHIKLAMAPNIASYGTHHTKMMLLFADKGMRIVIHTANMVESDWTYKTQGAWVSPLLPRLDPRCDKDPEPMPDHPEDLLPKVPAGFGRDFVQYLLQYIKRESTVPGAPTGAFDPTSASYLSNIIRKVLAHDLSVVKGVTFVGSVPGYHHGAQRDLWGHQKLKTELKRIDQRTLSRNDHLVGQFSSIASMGRNNSDKWFRENMHYSMNGGLTTTPGPPLSIVWPTPDDVLNSLAGWSSGDSLPFSFSNSQNAQFLRRLCHRWQATWCERTKASPHIKTYARWRQDGRSLVWVLLTSANLSKAAWGELQKQGSQLTIRSYEAGVLFTEAGVGKRIVPCSGDIDLTQEMCCPLPYDFPLTPYRQPDDEMFVWDVRYTKPDLHGNFRT